MAFVISIQAVFAAIVVLIAMMFGQSVALSAAFGAAVALLPNILFALYLKMTGRPSVGRLILGETLKFVLILTLSFYAWHRIDFIVQPLPYWVALIVVLKAHNFGLLRTAK